MHKFIFLNLFCVSLLINVTAQDHNLFEFASQANGVVTIAGNLTDGAPMSNLSWAWNSSNACFVETQAKKFKGQHVLYRTEIPTRAEMTIRLIPKDPTANFSLYAYSGGGGDVVPKLSSCVSCEADYKWDYKYRGKTQDHTRAVQLRAINNPYLITIGVVGPAGAKEGDFTLEVSIVGGE